MNVSRDDRQPVPDGFWARLRASLASTWNALAGGAAPSESPDTGPHRDDEPDASLPPVGNGNDGNGRSTERIMTPEEQVIEIVSENGGGMKQAEIVSVLDWSESTVSRKLSNLEANEAVKRYQIGREKLVYLPGSEPETLESPFGGADADQSTRV